MRAPVRTSLACLTLVGPWHWVAAQPGQSVRAPHRGGAVTDVRCNLATTYRLERGAALKVRSKPRGNAPVVARLGEGRIVYVCDSAGGGWLNVFFGGVEGPCYRTYQDGLKLREARNCRSGWVRRHWVNILSG